METLDYGFLPIIKNMLHFEYVQGVELIEDCKGNYYQLVKSNNLKGNRGQLALIEV